MIIISGALEPALTYNVLQACIYNGVSCRWGCWLSEKTDAWPPVVLGDGFRVDDDLVREGVGIGSGDGWDVVFVSVHDGDNLMRRLFERLGHGPANFEDVCYSVSACISSDSHSMMHTSLGPWLGERNIQRPLLPAYILVGLSEEVCLSPLLLKELHHNLPPSSRLVRAIYRAD